MWVWWQWHTPFDAAGFCVAVVAADALVVVVTTNVPDVFVLDGLFVVAVASPDAPAAAAAAYAVDIGGGPTSVADFVVLYLAAVFLFASAVANMSSSGVTFSILSSAVDAPSVVVGIVLAVMFVIVIKIFRFVHFRRC